MSGGQAMCFCSPQVAEWIEINNDCVPARRFGISDAGHALHFFRTWNLRSGAVSLPELVQLSTANANNVTCHSVHMQSEHNVPEE